MLPNTNAGYDTTCNALRKAIDDCKYKIKITEANQQQIDTIKQKKESMQESIDALVKVKEYLEPITKDIKTYLAIRKSQSMQAINNAIRIAGDIIPDAMPSISFELKGDAAWLQTSEGLLVNLSEGAGYKSILSAFLRSVTLNSNPDIQQLIIFDEIFSKVSVEYSATLSAFLGLMVQNMQIISIEQKPEVYANVDYVDYTFTKTTDYTTVTRKDVKNGSLQSGGIAGDEVPIQNDIA